MALVISYPKDPIFADQSERVVWECLMSQLPVDAIVICNLKILEHPRQYEMDFIVAWPDLGVAVLEVKGGKVTPNEDSTFTQSGGNKSYQIDPMTQTSQNLFALKRYLAVKSSFQHFSSRPHIVLPYSDIPSSYSRPNIPREVIHDYVDLATLVSRLERDVSNSNFRPSAVELSALLKILGQAINSQRSLMEMGVERAQVVDELTERQNQILDYCKAMPRFSILGAAGCGKTFVAVEQARRRTRAGDRVLFLCYNKGLSEYLRRRFETFPENERAAVVTTLQSLSYKLGLDIQPRQDDLFWDEELPLLLSQKLAELAVDRKFDTVIIDEAQDFHPSWWLVVNSALKDSVNGRIYAFGDLRQGIFRHATDIPLTPAALHLDTNLRNSVSISKLAALCIEDELILAGLDGPPVRYEECETDDAISTGDSVLQDLLANGWKPSEICLLTTGSRHPKQREKTEGSSKTAYWNSFFDEEEVFYGHILGFKGLERRVIVLVLNGWKSPDAKKDFLYTGITRARDVLVICGSSEDLKQSGGKEFLKALRKA